MEPALLIAEYRAKGVLIDTNLLVLLAVGLYKPDRISTFNRTRQYTLDDFKLVERIVRGFERLVTTPQILAEADNLTRQLPTREHHAIANVIAALIVRLFEVYVPSSDTVKNERYPDLGLTDCTTIAAADNLLVITDDFRLSNVLRYLGHDAINLNHLRPAAWGS